MNTYGNSRASKQKPEVFSVCRLCLELSTMSLYPVSELKMCLFSILPNLDLSLSKNPGVCLNCTTILMDSYNFKNRCSNNQERILKYCNILKEPVDLHNFVKEDSFIKGNANESYSFACNNAKESKEVDDEVELLDISKCTRESLIAHENPTEDILGGISKAELKEQIDLEVENGDSPYEVSDGGRKWCFLSDDDEDMEFFEKSGFKMTEKYVNNGYEACVSDNKTNHSNVIDRDKVQFNYTQEFEFESDITKEEVIIGYSCGSEGIAQFDETDQAVENCALIKTILAENTELTSTELNHKIWKKVDRQLFLCLLCQKKFVQKLHLDGHLLNKHKDIPKIEKVIQSKIHYCSYCVYSTINTYNLTSHMLTKHGKPPDSKHKMKKLHCLHCNYTTFNKGNLALHVRIHNQVKLFSCFYCDMSFNQKSSLNGHYLNHHGKEKNVNKLITGQIYVCDICHWKTLDKSRYNKHLPCHKRTQRLKKGKISL